MVEGGSKIANLFKDKYERLFNSVKCSEDEHNLLATNIDLEADNFCSNAEICKGSEGTHCYVISSSDVMSAICKIKTDKIIFTWWRVIVSILKHIVCINGLSWILSCVVFVLTLFPSQKVLKVNLSDSDKYRSIAICSLLGKF